MPIYDYLCESCGYTFEQMQSIKDDALIKCPECKKKKLKRVIAATNVIFKGSGWTPKGNMGE